MLPFGYNAGERGARGEKGDPGEPGTRVCLLAFLRRSRELQYSFGSEKWVAPAPVQLAEANANAFMNGFGLPEQNRLTTASFSFASLSFLSISFAQLTQYSV